MNDLTHLIMVGNNTFESIAKEKVKRSKGINSIDENNRTILHFHIAVANYPLSKEFLKLGADPNMHLEGHDGPIHVAAENSVEATKLLLKYGADINMLGKHSTPLIAAMKKDKFAVAELLIKMGADLEATSRGDDTPLMAASRIRDLTWTELLIKAGANIEAKKPDGRTALAIAKEYKNFKIASCLENHLLTRSVNANVEDLNSENKKTVLRRNRI